MSYGRNYSYLNKYHVSIILHVQILMHQGKYIFYLCIIVLHYSTPILQLIGFIVKSIESICRNLICISIVCILCIISTINNGMTFTRKEFFLPTFDIDRKNFSPWYYWGIGKLGDFRSNLFKPPTFLINISVVSFYLVQYICSVHDCVCCPLLQAPCNQLVPESVWCSDSITESGLHTTAFNRSPALAPTSLLSPPADKHYQLPFTWPSTTSNVFLTLIN